VVFDLLAAGVLVVVLLVALQSAHRDAGEHSRRARSERDRVRLVGRLNLLGGAAVVAALIVGLGVLGALVRGEVLDLPAFDMNAERSVPTLFSGGLLLVAAGGAYVLGRSQESQGTRSWWVLALFLAFMSFDETMSVHERLQSRIGVTGQVLLAPVVLVGAAAWLSAVRALWWHRVASWWLIGGAAAWLSTQVIDVLQSSGRLDALTVVEEMLGDGWLRPLLPGHPHGSPGPAPKRFARDRRASGPPPPPRKASSSDGRQVAVPVDPPSV
jgi:hypothetical protein